MLRERERGEREREYSVYKKRCYIVIGIQTAFSFSSFFAVSPTKSPLRGQFYGKKIHFFICMCGACREI